MKKQAKKIAKKATINTTTPAGWAPKIGDNIAIRTVTHYHVGEFRGVYELGNTTFVCLAFAAWVADTGRWSDFLGQGTANEVEPFPGPCMVSAGAVVDIAPWIHGLLRSVK